jgi:Tfp pilus assembly protein PilO
MQIEKDQWIVFAVIAGLTLAFVVGVWMPESRKVTELKARIATAESELGPNFSQPTALAERQERVAALQQQLEASDRFVPQGPELAKLLLSLAEATEVQGIDDPQTQTHESRHYRLYSEIPVELEMAGDFASIYRLLGEIEAMPRLVRIDALNLRRVQTDREPGSEGPAMRASLRLNSFFTPLEGPPS